MQIFIAEAGNPWTTGPLIHSLVAIPDQQLPDLRDTARRAMETIHRIWMQSVCRLGVTEVGFRTVPPISAMLNAKNRSLGHRCGSLLVNAVLDAGGRIGMNGRKRVGGEWEYRRPLARALVCDAVLRRAAQLPFGGTVLLRPVASLVRDYRYVRQDLAGRHEHAEPRRRLSVDHVHIGPPILWPPDRPDGHWDETFQNAAGSHYAEAGIHYSEMSFEIDFIIRFLARYQRHVAQGNDTLGLLQARRPQHKIPAV